MGKAIVEGCSICLESISERAIAVPCNHATFDFLCLVSWLQDHPTCPLCKVRVGAVQYDWASPNDYKTYLVPAADAKRSATPTAVEATHTFHPRALRNRRRYLSHYASNVTRDALVRRRKVYRDHLYSCHIGTNRFSEFKDFTPQSFCGDKVLQSRAREFIRRELQVFDFLSPESSTSSMSFSRKRHQGHFANAEFLLEYIHAILKSADIKGSTGKVESMVGQFLGSDNARLFLHELNAFLRSPYTDLKTWDRHVQYRDSEASEGRALNTNK